MKTLICVCFLGALTLGQSRADDVAVKAIPADSTLSPDKRYGITVPPSVMDPDALGETNDLIDVKSKRVLGQINADTAFLRMNHSELLPVWWSSDDTYLLWQVEGKWGMDTQILVRIKDGEIDWELDVTKVLQREILTHTEEADPKKFLAAKEKNWGDGSAYPEKFVFDSQAQGYGKKLLTFPVKFRVYLTSDCKGIGREPALDSSMEATLSENGEIKITGFQMGRNPGAPWYEVQNAGAQ